MVRGVAVGPGVRVDGTTLIEGVTVADWVTGSGLPTTFVTGVTGGVTDAAGEQPENIIKVKITANKRCIYPQQGGAYCHQHTPQSRQVKNQTKAITSISN